MMWRPVAMDRRAILAFVLAAALPNAASAATDEKKKGGGITYVQFTTLTASLLRGDGRRRRVLTVEAGLDVPDEKLRERVNLVAPRLRAAFVQALQIYASRLSSTSVPNADLLRGELQKETDRILGQKGARVLLGTLLIN